MKTFDPPSQLPSDEPTEATLTFHEQSDGRKVGRLPGGKVVLVDNLHMGRVADGERWMVRLKHRETFAIAEPVDLAPEVLLPNPVIPSTFRMAAPPPRKPAVQAAMPPAAPLAPSRAPDQTGPPEREPSAAASAALNGRLKIVPADILRATDRVALFIDGANMDGAARSAGYFLDYRKAREFLLGGSRFYAGFYYIADFTASDPLQQRYLDFLSHAGYIVRRRPVKVIHDQDTGERIIKGNLDTEIVLDLLNTVDNYDVAFLCSGDSDFERAVDLLRSRGKRVYVVTARGSLSRELSYVADKPIFFIDDHREALFREDRGAPAKNGG